MRTKPILKVIATFAFLSTLFISPLIIKAQSGDKTLETGMVNASINEKNELVIIPSKTSSKTDFDFFNGSWDVNNRQLKGRLQNSNEWITFPAKNEVTIILRGTGNTDRYYSKRNGQDFEGATLRLFDPKTKLWSLYWSDSINGVLNTPMVGSFDGNIGRFYANDTFNGKDVIEVFKWDKTDPDNPVWSQALSTDNGKTWEWNWYMYFKKIRNEMKDPELSENQNIKVLELRNYIIKPGKRDDFIKYFEKHFITSQNILGGYVLGQFRIKDADSQFLWFRGYNDMAARSVYLPEFYRKSRVWKTFGPGANTLLDDSDDVYLLRPLAGIDGANEQSKGINTNDFAKHKGIVVIDYYTANEGGLDQLISLYKSKYAPLLQTAGIKNNTLWVSELSQNDFPALPAKQEKNLLVAITFYNDEADYNSKLKLVGTDVIQSEMKKFIRDKHTMIVYPTTKSFGEATY